jgi:hypothetical protein
MDIRRANLPHHCSPPLAPVWGVTVPVAGAIVTAVAAIRGIAVGVTARGIVTAVTGIRPESTKVATSEAAYPARATAKTPEAAVEPAAAVEASATAVKTSATATASFRGANRNRGGESDRGDSRCYCQFVGHGIFHFDHDARSGLGQTDRYARASLIVYAKRQISVLLESGFCSESWFPRSSTGLQRHICWGAIRRSVRRVGPVGSSESCAVIGRSPLLCQSASRSFTEADGDSTFLAWGQACFALRRVGRTEAIATDSAASSIESLPLDCPGHALGS